MRNFLRVIKMAWRYRRRLIFSVFCALIAAMLWGLNISALYPVLQILGNKKDQDNLQGWANVKIVGAEKEIDSLKAELVKIENEQETSKRLPAGEEREEKLVKAQLDLNHVNNKISSCQSRLWRISQLNFYVIRHLPQDKFNTLALILLLVVIGVAVKGVFEFGQEYSVGIVTNRTALDLRNRLYRRCVHQDMRQIQEGGSADLMSRFTNDIEVINNGLKLLFGRLIGDPLKAGACLIIAFFISWQLTLLFALIVLPAILIMTNASKMMKKATRRMLDRMGEMYKILQETFQGLRVVKAFTMESYERRRFHDAARDYAARNLKTVRIDAVTGPMVELTGITAISLALLAGAYLVISGEKRIFGIQFTYVPMETEALLLLYAQLIGMADPVRKLSSVYTKLQSAAAASDRVFHIMDKIPQVQLNCDGPVLERHSKEIEFRNVCFSYVPEKQVLTNICLTVKAGETIGIVGSNGSGKSTLLNLLPRFYDPDHGSILIDGVELRKAKLRSLRKQIALVSQDPILFDDTIFNNIRYGSRKATKEQIELAAKKAGVDEFATTLPQGYETQAGDAGAKLSGGQKQRIALARAILRDPSILILDEFSSAIDPKSDAMIHEAIRDFKKGRTTFFITHKMHTLEMADRIVVIDNHVVAAIGTHAELMRESEIYRGLYDAQIQLRVA